MSMDGSAIYQFKAGLSFQEIGDAIRSALQDRYPVKPGSMDCGAWIETTYADRVVYRYDGKFWESKFTISDQGEAVLEEPVRVKTSYTKAFSFDTVFAAFSKSVAPGDMVKRIGKLFEGGKFDDKNVEFTDDDIDVAVTDFAPVDNDLEHMPTILDGKLGGIVKVWKQGTNEIFGEVLVPKWLDDLVGDEPLKTSLAFNREKKIVGNALVLRPRITDASIVAAFSEATTPGSGAPANKKMKITFKDLLARLGLGNTSATQFSLESEIEVSDDLLGNLTGHTPGTQPNPVVPATQTPTAPVANFSTDPSFVAMQTQLQTMQNQAIRTTAFAFADGVIAAGKAVPAQRDQIASMFSSAVSLDATAAGYAFNDAGLVEGVNVKGIKDFFEAAQPVNVFGEAFMQSAAQGDVMVFGHGGASKDGAMSDDRMKQLMGSTQLGRAALGASSKN